MFLKGIAWALLITSVVAQNAAAPQRYRLLGDSTLTDDCPICDRITIPRPARGTFDLISMNPSETQNRYQLAEIRIQSALSSGEPVEITGQGDLQVDTLSGQVTAVLHIRSSHSTNEYTFIREAEVPAVIRLWPIFEVSLIETQAATFTQTFHLHLLAAPIRALWFSTASGMTRGIPGPVAERVAADDFVSDSGGVVRRGTNLLSAAGLPIDPTDHRIDATQPGPGGEVFFSLTKDDSSTSIGPVQSGDLISDHGRRIAGYLDLLRDFGIMPPVPDLGLDAVQVQPDGEILFSIAGTAFSETLGINLGPGDLLSSHGRRLHSAKELLAAFQPVDSNLDAGLDAIFVWPSGEIWFSTETGFNSAQGPIGAGDLLSDQGYVVFRNLELVQAFAPLEDLADFGLDALWIVSDAAANAFQQPTLAIRWESGSRQIRIDAAGSGAAFQLEQAAYPTGPFLPWGPIQPETVWFDSVGSEPMVRAFYRLRQW